MTATIVRAQILHTPRDPVRDGGAAALEAFSDGGPAYGDDGRILATGSFADVRAKHPDAEVVDASDAPRSSARACASRAGSSSRTATCSPSCT